METSAPALLTPGPTPVRAEVREAMSQPLPYHESRAFRLSYRRAVDNLAWLFRTSREPVVANSSITGACASVFTNLTEPGDGVLCAVNGHFSNLVYRLAQAACAEAHLLEVAWGGRVEPAAVDDALSAHTGIKVVCLAHCETTTGAISDVRAVAEVAHAHGALVAIDAASTLGAAQLETDDWDLDVVVSGSQKALGVPPGLAFLAISERAWEASRAVNCRRFDWDWSMLQEAQTAGSLYTPAITLWLGLDASLILAREAGHRALWGRAARLARAVRAGAQALGLELLSPDEDGAVSVTAIRVPAGMDAEVVQAALVRTHGVLVAIGHPVFMRNELIRISTMGHVEPQTLLIALQGLGEVLVDAGILDRADADAGRIAAENVLKADLSSD